MLFLLLIVGSNAAWGRTPTIFGEGLPGLNTCSDCGDWNNNSKVMQSMGEDGYWYAEFLDVDATDNNKYRFKIAINDGDWWNGAMNSGNTNESMGNVDIVNGKDGDNQISFKMPFDGDVYIFYKSTNADNSKVWIVAVPSNIAAPPTGQSQPGFDSDRTLKTDLIFKSSRNGWGDGIKFTRSFATTYKHVTSYILPAKKNAETGNIRFEMYKAGARYINGKPTPAQLSTSTPRRIIYMWNGDENGSWIAYTLPTYPVRKSGWKLFVKDYNSGNPTTMDANGSATLTLNGGSSYDFFIANTDYATNISNYSSDICSTPAVHSVNCFGGCYIDESNSSNVTFSEQQVYVSSSCGTLVKSVVEAQDLRGRFTVSGSGQKDVTFTFDGGKITINAVDHGSTPEPPTPSGVTYDGSEIFYFHKNSSGFAWNIWANDCALYLQFSNADESNTARSTKIGYFWDSDNTSGDVLATRVPAGTWTKVRVIRTNNGNRGQVWNEGSYATLEEGKNYINNSNTMAVYSPRTFHFYISGSTTLANTGSDFNAWNGNGTAHSGSMTKLLNAGTYKFKLNPTGTVDWRSEFNTDDLDLTNSSDNINLRDGGNKEIWFDLATQSEVTIACDGNKVTVNATPYVPALTNEELYVFGAGGTNWVTGWSSNWDSEDYKMTISAGIASKTFYNVSGSGLRFKIRNKTNGDAQYKYDMIDGSACSGITDLGDCDNNLNICFSLAQTSDVTVYTDGTHVWLTAVPSPAHFGANQYVFWHSNAGSWGTILFGRDRTQFLEFRNTSTSATGHTSKPAFMFEAGADVDGAPAGVIAAIAPEGTWNQVRVCRINSDTWNGNPIEGSSDWFTIEDGKNYIYKEGGVIKFGTKSLDNFQFYLAASSSMGEGGDFVWNGNGTVRTNSVTKTLSANDYGFKLNPTGAYIYSNRNYWLSEFNWDDIDASNSSNNISLRNGGNKEIWFTLSRKSDVTIACNGSKVTVNATPYYNVTFNSDGGSDVAAQEILSGGTVTEPSDPTRGSGYTFNFWKLSGESSAYDFSTPVTSDIELVADWTAPTLYTVTFNSNGGSPVDAQEVVENETATEPAEPTRDNYTFGGWKLGNVLYDFDTPVTDDIELVADWTYAPAHISSVSINESSIYTWEGDATTYTLVPTLVPGDIASITVSWSSSDNNVATVENGVITPQGSGTATITCTATDYYDGSQTATCAVKVAPCAKALADAPSYSVTITGRDSYEGGSATLTGLWNPSVDNSEPAELEKIRIQYPNGNGNDSRPIAVDADHRVIAQSNLTDNSDYWYRIPAGENIHNNDNGGHDYAVYYLKNVKTGEYMYVDKSVEYGLNGDYWHYFATRTSAEMTNENKNIYKWFTAVNYGQGDHRNVIVNKDGFNGTYTGDGARSNIGLYRTEVNPSNTWQDPYIKTGQKIMNGYQNAHTGMVPTISSENITNPAYIQSQMNSSYYRMKANATVQANLSSALAEADVISVELYADAATSVTLCKTNGDVVATINLNADAATEYSYLVTAGTMLDGESAFIIKAADNHAGIRSIAVTPMVTESPAQPDLHWTTTPVTAHLLLDGNFTYTAASNDSKGAISYASEDTDVAQVDASTGEVTPSGAGTTNIIATITADECYTTYSISYEVSFLGLQDYINTDGVNSVTLPGDYTSENIVINKPFTINGAGHAIGNLTVETAGDLTLSGALTVNDFSIYAKAGNTTTPAASGQVRNATNLTANGNAYFYYTVDPSGTVHYGWYDFTVPFRVNVMTGIAGIENEVLNEDFVNERNYAIMEHLGDKQAAGQYAYKKFRGIMEPCRLYSITLDDDYNYNTIRFKKADGALAAGNEVTLNAYAGEAKHANWNGVGNGTLHHADVEVSTVGYIQVYQSGDKTFLPVDRGQYSLVVGSAFMIQQAGTMTLNQATHNKLLAPRRAANAQPTAIQIASEGQPFSDQLFISADETAGQGYTQGVDVAKAGNIGNVNVPQIWTNAYNTSLCAHEAQLIDGEAQYTLSLYAPANGTYTLTSKNIPEGYTLYLTQNGNKLWDMSDTYVLDLTKGTTTEYGLLLVENYKMPTAVDNIYSNTDETTKIMRNGILYILQNGKVFNAQGARVK